MCGLRAGWRLGAGGGSWGGAEVGVGSGVARAGYWECARGLFAGIMESGRSVVTGILGSVAWANLIAMLGGASSQDGPNAGFQYAAWARSAAPRFGASKPTFAATITTLDRLPVLG